MYDTDTKNQFLELRAKGWSLARIAERLKVAQRTLVDWNRQEHEQDGASRECHRQRAVLTEHRPAPQLAD